MPGIGIDPADRTPPARAAKLVEIAGVSASGKTTSCRLLLDRSHEARQSFVSARWRALRRSAGSRLFLPMTLLRYRRLFAVLSSASHRRFARARSILPFFWQRSRALRRSDDPLVSTLFLLLSITAEIALARLESTCRRRTLVLDEGPVHRAVGVWTRCPASARDAALAAYAASLPAGIAAVVLRCEPRIAIDRAGGRERGVPLAVERASGTLRNAGGASAIDSVFAAQAALFDDPAIRSRCRVIDVDAGGTPEEIADQIDAALGRLGVPARRLFFLRE